VNVLGLPAVLDDSDPMVRSTPLPAVCSTLARKDRNYAIAFFTSPSAAFSTALSGAFVACSTSFLISTACRKKIGVTCATS